MVNQGKRGPNRWGFTPIANYLTYKVGLPTGNFYLPNYSPSLFSGIFSHPYLINLITSIIPTTIGQLCSSAL